MRKFINSLGLISAIITLNACKTVMDPTFLPSGYTYHHDTYKSPPADKPWSIGYDYSRAENAAILNKWQNVAADVTDQLVATAPLDTMPVFLASPDIDNAFSLSLDHALREEFRSRGYELVAIPSEDAFKIKASTYDPDFKDVMRSYNLNDQTQKDLPEPPKEVSKKLVIKIDGLIDGTPSALVEAPYELPLYGYQDKQLYFPVTQAFSEVWR